MIRGMPLSVLVAIAVLVLGGCGGWPTSKPDPSSAPSVLASTSFTGCAFLDTNANGLVDSEDAPIGEMIFSVNLAEGTGFGSVTSDGSGCAHVLIPMALPEEGWPVVVEMVVPESLGYVPVKEVRKTLAYPETRADFLFSEP